MCIRDRYINTRIEVELAFVLGRPLSGPNCTITDVLDATAYVIPALEILSSNIEMAVSYTHLDVYKRQDELHGLRHLIDDRLQLPQDGGDVDDRQVGKLADQAMDEIRLLRG